MPWLSCCIEQSAKKGTSRRTTGRPVWTASRCCWAGASTTTPSSRTRATTPRCTRRDTAYSLGHRLFQCSTSMSKGQPRPTCHRGPLWHASHGAPGQKEQAWYVCASHVSCHTQACHLAILHGARRRPSTTLARRHRCLRSKQTRMWRPSLASAFPSRHSILCMHTIVTGVELVTMLLGIQHWRWAARWLLLSRCP